MIQKLNGLPEWMNVYSGNDLSSPELKQLLAMFYMVSPFRRRIGGISPRGEHILIYKGKMMVFYDKKGDGDSRHAQFLYDVNSVRDTSETRSFQDAVFAHFELMFEFCYEEVPGFSSKLG